MRVKRDRILIDPSTCRRATRYPSLIAFLTLSVLYSQSSLTELYSQSPCPKILPTYTESLPCSESRICSSSTGSKVNADDVHASVGRKQAQTAEVQQDKEEEEGKKREDDLLTSLGAKPRAFPLWQNGTLELPCEKPEAHWKLVQREHTTSGILYVKVPKTGSSTTSGVTLRIASRLGAKHNVTPLCKNRVQHANVHTMRYNERNRSRSILWSMVREPNRRMVSEYFHFLISRRGKKPSDANFQAYVKNFHSISTQTRYLSFRKPTNLKTPIREVNEILQNYDFIGISERMDESFVALQMILGLETADVMYISAKASGSFDDGRFRNKCTFIQKSVMYPFMGSFFAGEEWRNFSRHDQLLYRTVNRSLDLTIEQLGRAKFEENLHKLRVMQKKVDQECLPTVRMPCNMPGIQHGDPPQNTTDCIYDDMGCGFECLDQLIAQKKE